MDKKRLKSHMAMFGDTQETLSLAMGLSLSRLNAKINNSSNAEFTQSEIMFIVNRYSLSPEETQLVFFN